MSRLANRETNLASLAVSILLTIGLSFAAGCGEANVAPPRGDGGTAGSGGYGGDCGFLGCGGRGGSAGSAGIGGSGGDCGFLGCGGAGGSGGSAGSAGSGGSAGNGGSGGAAGSGGACVTSALCHTCPDSRFLCSSDSNCFPGYSCIPSGCKTQQGAAIKQCQPSKAPSCVDVSECPNSSDYECGTVGAGSSRCLRVTPGCDPASESYDCFPGFSCEDGDCVDRRVPCDDYRDCPKSHVCRTEPTASYCVRVYRTCHDDDDCAGFGAFCADVDGDGTDECTGELGGSAAACVNSSCSSPSAPVCDAGGTGTSAACGDHGLCLSNSDCGTGFSCVALWQDGRKECVPDDGACNQVSQCPLQQVCAAPRNGNPPSCQSGTGP